MAKALTAAAVEKAKADPARRLEVPDGLLPGLYLVIQPSGRKSWAARYRVRGKTVKLTIGTYPAVDLPAARHAACEALRSVASGSDPAAEKRQNKEMRADDDIFPAIARSFIARHARPRNRRWREQARLIGLIPDKACPDKADDPASFVIRPGSLAARWERTRVGDISRSALVTALDRIADEGKGALANRILDVLRPLFKWAISRGVMVESPAALVSKPAPAVSRDRTLTDLELRALWRAADAAGYPLGRMVQLLILTGQRRDEVASMRRAEIDGSVWSLPAARVKNGRPHVVPLSEQATALLASLPKVEGPYAFTTTGRSPVSGFSRFKRALEARMLAELRKDAERLGDDPSTIALAPWRLHDIRRTAATGMARLGVDLHVVEKVLNHVSGAFAGIVGVYQRHDYAEGKRKALEKWACHIATLVEEPE